MTDNNEKAETSRKSAPPSHRSQSPPARRPSYDKVAKELENWANSPGLQRPT